MASGTVEQDRGCTGKQEWPELLGAKGEEAAAVIERENTRVKALVVLQGFKVILNFRCDRVWVWVNDKGIVYRVPRVG